jgi:hypothetical protein
MFQNCIQDDVHDIEGEKKSHWHVFSIQSGASSHGNPPASEHPDSRRHPDSFSIRLPDQFPDFQLGIYWAVEMLSVY